MKSIVKTIAAVMMAASFTAAADITNFESVAHPGGSFEFEWHGYGASDGFGIVRSGGGGYSLFDGTSAYVMGIDPDGDIEVVEVPNCDSPEAQVAQPSFCHISGERVLRMDCDAIKYSLLFCVGTGPWVDEYGPVSGLQHNGVLYNMACNIQSRQVWGSGSTHARCEILDH